MTDKTPLIPEWEDVLRNRCRRSAPWWRTAGISIGPRRPWQGKVLGLTALGLASTLLGTVLGHPAVLYAHQPVASAPALPPLVFDSVTVIDVQQGHELPNQRVVIVGTRIRSMGSASAVQVPAGARVVDARGKYLIPGLWDMHVHPMHATDIFYPLFIANGITGIRDASSQVPLDTLILWRREILAGTRVGPPRQILVGRALESSTSRMCPREIPLLACVTDPADARRLVDSLKAAGADMIKTHKLSPALYFAIAAEARRMGIPFGGHVEGPEGGLPTTVTAIEASDSGARILDHRTEAGGLDTLCAGGHGASVARCRPVAAQFQRNGTWWCPTLVVYDGIPHALGKRLDLLQQAFWAGSRYTRDSLRALARTVWVPYSDDSSGLLSIARRVGLPILAGTDQAQLLFDLNFYSWHMAGFWLHKELALYAAEGLTPLEALQTATLNPARAFHLTDSLGTVAPGKLADLVLLDADPLQDITNTTTIRAVVANGRYFDRTTLDQLIVDAKTKIKQ